jgi:Mn2+/Fe2+ NRAMP family transporter
VAVVAEHDRVAALREQRRDLYVVWVVVVVVVVCVVLVSAAAAMASATTRLGAAARERRGINKPVHSHWSSTWPLR